MNVLNTTKRKSDKFVNKMYATNASSIRAEGKYREIQRGEGIERPLFCVIFAATEFCTKKVTIRKLERRIVEYFT